MVDQVFRAHISPKSDLALSATACTMQASLLQILMINMGNIIDKQKINESPWQLMSLTAQTAPHFTGAFKL